MTLAAAAYAVSRAIIVALKGRQGLRWALLDQNLRGALLLVGHRPGRSVGDGPDQPTSHSFHTRRIQTKIAILSWSRLLEYGSWTEAIFARSSNLEAIDLQGQITL